MRPDAAYATGAAALWAWQRHAGLPDKAVARLAGGISPNTVKSARARGDLFGIKTLFALKQRLPACWWDLVTGTHDPAADIEMEARRVALETRLALLQEEIARTKEAR